MIDQQQTLWLSRVRYSGALGVISGILGAGFALIATDGLSVVYIWTRITTSLAGLFMVLTFPITLIVTAVAYRHLLPDEVQNAAYVIEKHRSHLIGRLSIAPVMAFLLTALCMITFILISNTFVGGRIERWSAVAAGGLYAGLLAFVVAYIASQLDRTQMLMLSGLTVVIGLGATAAASTERAWIAGALRFLGYNSGPALIFSLTLILTGFVVLAWALDIVYQLELLTEARQFPQREFTVLRLCLLAMGFFFIGIGLFPDEANTINGLLHRVSAIALLVLFMVLTASTRVYKTIYPSWFVVVSLTLGGIAAAFGLLWLLLHTIDSSLAEIVLALTITPWFFAFEQQTRAYVAGKSGDAQVGILRRRMRFSAQVAAVAAVASGTLALFFVNNTTSLLILLTALVSTAATLVGYRRFVPEDADIHEIAQLTRQRRSIFAGRIVVAAAVGVLLTAIAMLVAYVIHETLPQQTVTSVGMIVMAIGYGGLLGFAVAYVAVYLDRSQLVILTGVIIAAGIIIAAVSAVDPNWWKESISFLGQDESSALFFNFAFILAGLLVLVIAWDVLYELRLLMLANIFTRRNYRLFEVSLGSIGLFLIGIGLFPIRISGLSYALHNICAHSVVGVFVVLMFVLGRLTRIYTRGFIAFSWVMGAASVTAILLWQRRVFNFVFMELVLLLIVGVWFYVFEQETREYIEEQDISDFKAHMTSINSP